MVSTHTEHASRSVWRIIVGPGNVPEHRKDRLSPPSAASIAEFALLPAVGSRLPGQLELLILLAAGMFEEVGINLEGEAVVALRDRG
jgi:hypothetical protein